MSPTTTDTVEKVTAFVTRPTGQGDELLLFQHPSAGIQLPAGTVEQDEAPAAAALREAQEETGLAGFASQRHLTSAADPLPAGAVVVTGAAPVYERPDLSSAAWAKLRRGIVVKVLRRQPGFAQINVETWNSLDNPQYVTFGLTGWVAEEAVTEQRIRHFFHFTFAHPTPPRWVTHTDHHDFTLFWAPLTELPELVAPQQAWLHHLTPVFPQLRIYNTGDEQ